MPPTAAGATQGQDDGQFGTNVQQVSGPSVFWALATIVVNAMTQPSFCGYLWNGNSFEGYLWPHRSSPTICIADAVAETWIIVNQFRHPLDTDHQEPSAAAKPTDVILRLAIFFLTVMPAVIKIFSISGILVTQLLAASFLLATLVSMIRGLFIEAPQRDVRKLAEQLEARKKGLIKKDIAVLAGLLHGIMLYWLWCDISSVARISASRDVANVADWACQILSVLCMAYILQYAFFNMAGSTSPIPRFPFISIFFLSGNLSISDLMLDPKAPQLSRTRSWVLAEALLFDVFLCSYVLAILLELLAKILLKRFSSSVESETDISDHQRHGRGSAAAAPHTADQVTRAADESATPVYPGATTSSTADDTLPDAQEDFHADIAKATERHGGNGPVRDAREESSTTIARTAEQESENSLAARTFSVRRKMLTVIATVSIWIPLLIWRLVSSSSSLLDHGLTWFQQKIISRSKYSLIAFAIGNFATAAIYYMIYFDNTMAFTPAWTNSLG